MDKIILSTISHIMEDSGFKSSYDYLQYGFVVSSDIENIGFLTSQAPSPSFLWMRYKNLDGDTLGLDFQIILKDLKLAELYYKISLIQERFLKDNPIPEEDEIDNIWKD